MDGLLVKNFTPPQTELFLSPLGHLTNRDGILEESVSQLAARGKHAARDRL
jgi:hypothetical protein